MALSDRVGLLSPPVEVRWAGWRSTSHLLQRCGWEFAMADSLHLDAIEVVMRHRDFGFVGWGSMRCEPFYRHYSQDQVLEITRVSHDSRTFVLQAPPLEFNRVDMAPAFSETKQVPFSALGIFRPWHEGKEELIVEPEDVSSLMERIRKLQEPELKKIRERNRRREGAKEQVLAQVICLAA